MESTDRGEVQKRARVTRARKRGHREIGGINCMNGRMILPYSRSSCRLDFHLVLSCLRGWNASG